MLSTVLALSLNHPHHYHKGLSVSSLACVCVVITAVDFLLCFVVVFVLFCCGVLFCFPSKDTLNVSVSPPGHYIYTNGRCRPIEQQLRSLTEISGRGDLLTTLKACDKTQLKKRNKAKKKKKKTKPTTTTEARLFTRVLDTSQTNEKMALVAAHTPGNIFQGDVKLS